MSNESSPWLPACPKCGAELASDGAPCWLCGNAGDGARAAGPEARAKRPVAMSTSPASFSLATLMLVMTLAAVWLGLLFAAPGLAIFVCILLVPVLVRTSLVVQRRAQAGKAVSPGEKVALVASSLLATLVIVVVACVASVGTFCAVCIGLYSVSNANDSASVTAMMAIAALVTLVILFLIGRPLGRWVKRRYRRDVGEP